MLALLARIFMKAKNTRFIVSQILLAMAALSLAGRALPPSWSTTSAANTSQTRWALIPPRHA
jgi:hypothetical protein